MSIFWETVSHLLLIVTGLKFIHMLHIFANTFLLFLCSGTRTLTETQKVNIHKYFNCNHADTCLDIPNSLGDKLVECQ